MPKATGQRIDGPENNKINQLTQKNLRIWKRFKILPTRRKMTGRENICQEGTLLESLFLAPCHAVDRPDCAALLLSFLNDNGLAMRSMA